MEPHHEDTNGTRRTVSAEIGIDGDLVAVTQDLGQAPQAVWGREYEFWVSVPPAQKDALLLALIADH